MNILIVQPTYLQTHSFTSLVTYCKWHILVKQGIFLTSKSALDSKKDTAQQEKFTNGCNGLQEYFKVSLQRHF